MSLLFRVLFAQKCTSTHHKLAMDALRLLECEHAQEWQNLFLKNVQVYLDGSKAPDKKFKDFKNHVLHVRDNFWGGAVVSVEKWYGRLVDVLKEQDWQRAVYAAGVMSHYYTDIWMPLHTGQTEEEGQVHRAMEWSVTKSYDDLRRILVDDLGGFPKTTLPDSDDWLALMVIDAAQQANHHYETLIDHYNLDAGVRNPPAGLDQESKDCLAGLLGGAAVGLARILERAFADAGATPPGVRVTLAGVLAKLTTPLFWITRKLANGADRTAVKAIYRELQNTGRVTDSLSDDDKAVRAQHAEEVLGVSLDELDRQEPRKAGTKHGEGKPDRTPTRRAKSKKKPEPSEAAEKPKRKKRLRRPRPAADAVEAAESAPAPKADASGSTGSTPKFYLDLNRPIVDAPSIGAKTARRFKRIGVKTIAEFLDCEPSETVEKLRVSWIDSDVLTVWQHQSSLMCRVPGLRGHDAQILVGCGVNDPETLRGFAVDELLELVQEFVTSPDGERILRSSAPPDHDEIANWIEWASLSRSLRAAA